MSRIDSNTSWVREYVLLGLRLDRALRRRDETPFVDSYYGPAELRQAVDGEPAPDLQALAEQAAALSERLAEQGFEPLRRGCLEANLRAMKAAACLLEDEAPPLEWLVEQILDVQAVWQPEGELERGLRLLDEALPGKGALRERFQSWTERTMLPAERNGEALSAMRLILDEARCRTARLVELPEGESLDLQVVQGKSYGAANWYLGGYRSRLELNLSRPMNLLGMVYQMAHEGYPGHHAEYSLKEAHLYREKGCIEQSLSLIGPQLVVSEGLALLASEIIFSAQELAEWVGERLLSLVGVNAAEVDLARLIEGSRSFMLDDIGSNLALLLERGESPAQALDYALSYTPYPREMLEQFCAFPKSRLMRIYTFTYSQGKNLLRPLLYGDGRAEYLRRLMTEQVYPGVLRSWG